MNKDMKNKILLDLVSNGIFAMRAGDFLLRVIKYKDEHGSPFFELKLEGLHKEKSDRLEALVNVSTKILDLLNDLDEV